MTTSHGPTASCRASNFEAFPVARRMLNFISGGCAPLQQGRIFSNAGVGLLVSVALLIDQISLERILRIRNRVDADLGG